MSIFRILKLRRFKGRNPQSISDVYDSCVEARGLDKDQWIQLFVQVAEILDLPPEVLRPFDRFSVELAPLPWFRVNDELELLGEWYGNIMSSLNSNDYPTVETIGQMIESILVAKSLVVANGNDSDMKGSVPESEEAS